MDPNNHAIPNRADIVLLSDGFNGSAIDTAKWVASGNSVVQDNGVMKVSQDITDAGGTLSSQPIAINPTGIITITHQAYLHYGNDYFIGKTLITIASLPTFAICYANMKYSNSTKLIPRSGFFMSRNNARVDTADTQSDVSAAISPVWDTWFDEKIVYNPISGIMELFINGVSQGNYNVGIVHSQSPTMTVAFSAWGWYTGHQFFLKDLRITQDKAAAH